MNRERKLMVWFLCTKLAQKIMRTQLEYPVLVTAIENRDY